VGKASEAGGDDSAGGTTRVQKEVGDEEFVDVTATAKRAPRNLVFDDDEVRFITYRHDDQIVQESMVSSEPTGRGADRRSRNAREFEDIERASRYRFGELDT